MAPHRRSSSRFVRGVCGLVVAMMGLLGRASLLRAQTPEARQRALALFQRGNEAFAAGNPFEAYDAYVRAFSLSPSFDIACNLGRTEAEMGKLTDGALHLRYCLRNFPASSRTDMREAETKFTELLRKVAGQVAQLRLVVEPGGTLVSVNGEEVGTSPISEALFLTPGKVKLVLSKPGYAVETFTFLAQAGSQQDMNVRLTPKSGGVVSAVTASDAPSGGATAERPQVARPAPSDGVRDPASPSVRTALLFGGASISVVGLGLGTYFSIQAAHENSDFRASRRAIQAEFGELGCQPGVAGVACESMASHREAAADKERWGFISFAGATGVSLVTAAVWLLWNPEPSAVSVTVGGDTRRGSVLFRGVF